MTTDNLDKLNHIFRLKSIRREGPELLKGREREDFTNIAEKFDKHRTSAEQLYRAEYKTRVEVERRALMDRAGSKSWDHKPVFGMVDKFNRRDLTRQAQLNVRADHQRTMERLDRQELNETEGFLDKSSRRKEYLEAFKQSSGRRRAQTRRESVERRRSPSPSMSD